MVIQSPKPQPLDATMHELVAHVAVEMAGAVYEECAKNDAWYKLNPDQKEFIRYTAPRMRNAARQTLAEMLNRSDVSATEKEQIAEALILDNSLPKEGVSVVPIRDKKGRWI